MNRGGALRRYLSPTLFYPDSFTTIHTWAQLAHMKASLTNVALTTQKLRAQMCP